MHQLIPLWKTLSYELSHTQNHVLWLPSIAHQVHVPLPFLMISCFSEAFYHLSLLPSSSVETLMFMWMDIDFIDQRKLFNLLDTSNLAQNVNKSTQLHGHKLDLTLSPNDFSFITNVTFGDLVSDHTLVKCHLFFACPWIPKVDSISYRRYHKISMQNFCMDLANTSFVTYPTSTAADLYD